MEDNWSEKAKEYMKDFDQQMEECRSLDSIAFGLGALVCAVMVVTEELTGIAEEINKNLV